MTKMVNEARRKILVLCMVGLSIHAYIALAMTLEMLERLSNTRIRHEKLPAEICESLRGVFVEVVLPRSKRNSGHDNKTG